MKRLRLLSILVMLFFITAMAQIPIALYAVGFVYEHNNVALAGISPQLQLSDKVVEYSKQPQELVATVASGAESLIVSYQYEGRGSTNYGPTSQAPTNAGTYTVTATTPQDGMYDAASVTASLTIKKIEATVVIENAEESYTGNPISVNAYVQEAPDAALVITYGGSVESPTEIGYYTVFAKFVGNENYLETENEGYLIIKQASPTLNLINTVVTYNGSPQAIQKEILPTIAENITLTYTYTGIDGTVYGPATSAPVNAGKYKVVAVSTEDQYFISSTSNEAVLTINKKEAAISADNLMQVYNNEPVVPLVEVTEPEDGAITTLTYKGAIGTDYAESTQAPSLVGTYEVIAHYAGNGNYAETQKTFEMSIEKATPILSLADMSVAYDGQPHVIVPATVSPDYAQHLLADAVYTYQLEGSGQVTSTPPSAMGKYQVIVTTAADRNFTEATATAVFEITRHLPIINIQDKSAQFTGEPITLEASLTEPQGGLLTITYTGTGSTDYAESTQAPTQGGTYEVAASYAGSDGYQPLRVTAKLIITQAESPTLAFENKTVSYNKQPQTIGEARILTIAGAYLQDAITYYYSAVDYPPSLTPPTNAGVYEVKAIIPADSNFKQTQQTATLTINKAVQEITYPVIGDRYKSTESFSLGVSVNTELPLTYRSSDETIAEVSAEGMVTAKKIGLVTITVEQAGNENYKAISVNRKMNVISNDNELAILIDGVPLQPEGNAFKFDMDCINLRDEITVQLVLREGATVDAENLEFSVDTRKAQEKKFAFVVTAHDGIAKETYTLDIRRFFRFEDIVVMRWNNTLLVNNNPQTNGGYTFVGYKWFKNGAEIGQKQYYSAGDKETDLLDDSSNAVYSVELTTEDGNVIPSCAANIRLKNMTVKVYPNPIQRNQLLRVEADMDSEQLEGGVVEVYGISGVRHSVQKVQGGISEISLPALAGTYILKFKAAGVQREMRVIVN